MDYILRYSSGASGLSGSMSELFSHCESQRLRGHTPVRLTISLSAVENGRWAEMECVCGNASRITLSRDGTYADAAIQSWESTSCSGVNTLIVAS